MPLDSAACCEDACKDACASPFVLPFCAFSKAPAPEHCSERTQANQQVLGQLEVWLHLVSLENPQVLIGITWEFLGRYALQTLKEHDRNAFTQFPWSHGDGLDGLRKPGCLRIVSDAVVAELRKGLPWCGFSMFLRIYVLAFVNALAGLLNFESAKWSDARATLCSLLSRQGIACFHFFHPLCKIL